ATCGRRVALALAPAGTGKSTAMAALSHAWRSSGGRVVGLAPTAAAAIELATDLGAPTDTVAKYVHLTRGAPTRTPPGWFDRIDHTALVILDEAGKAGTLELDAVIRHAVANGASVRLVGDDGQLASISAGGVLRDIATETDALTLSQLVRFACPAEGAASLAIRAGDPAGIGYYIDHHRLHVGAEQTAADMAYTACQTDTLAGRDSLLLPPPTTSSTRSTPAPAATASPPTHRHRGRRSCWPTSWPPPPAMWCAPAATRAGYGWAAATSSATATASTSFRFAMTAA
ncbi:MAG: AAA family ATPase, partial [Mycobacterium sp.]